MPCLLGGTGTGDAAGDNRPGQPWKQPVPGGQARQPPTWAWPGRRVLWETERKGVHEKGGVLERPEV